MILRLQATNQRLQAERDDLHTTALRLQVELDRLKKRYYGPRADKLQTMTDLAQMLLSFAEALGSCGTDEITPKQQRDRIQGDSFVCPTTTSAGALLYDGYQTYKAYSGCLAGVHE